MITSVLPSVGRHDVSTTVAKAAGKDGTPNWSHADVSTDIETISTVETVGLRHPRVQDCSDSILEDSQTHFFKQRTDSGLEKNVMDKLGSLHDSLEHVSERVDLMYEEMKSLKEQSKRNRSFQQRTRTLGSDMFGNSNHNPPSPSHQLGSSMFEGALARGRSCSGLGRSFARQPSAGSTDDKRSILAPTPEVGLQEQTSINTFASRGTDVTRNATGENPRQSASIAIPEESLLPTLPVAKRSASAEASRAGSGRRTAFVAPIHIQDSTRASLHGTQFYNLIKLGVRRYEFLDDIWMFLDEPESGSAAFYFTKGICYLILLSVFFPLLQTLRSPPLDDVLAAVIETTIDGIFCLIIMLRLISCPSKAKFFLSPTNWFDLCALPSLVLRMSLGFVLVRTERDTASGVILLCLVPVLRLLKMVRHFETFQILLGAFVLALEALPVLLYMLGVIMLASASFIYAVEPRENIESFPRAVWLSIVTITTVGYGDVTPTTSAGHVVVAALVLSSVLFMAMPLGIIGSAFNTTWNDRDRILLMQRTRRRLVQWGYTANDIFVLFKLVDLDGDGQLNFEEFNRLLKRLKIDLKDDRVVQLFSMFDCDGSGCVDPQEFVRLLYPTSFADVLPTDMPMKPANSLEMKSSVS